MIAMSIDAKVNKVAFRIFGQLSRLLESFLVCHMGKDLNLGFLPDHYWRAQRSCGGDDFEIATD